MTSGISTTTQNKYHVKYSDHWDKSLITVHINNEKVLPHYKPVYYKQIKKALEYWEQGGNGKLGFTPEFKLVDSEDSGISVSWVERLGQLPTTAVKSLACQVKLTI